MRALVAFMVAVAVLFGGSSVAAEPRPIHEGINVPAGCDLVPAVRGTQVQVGAPPGVWVGTIPSYYGGGTGCTQSLANLVAQAMWGVGANDQQVYRMLNIVSRESGCDSSAHNGNASTGDDSFGLCQLNARAGFFRSGGILAGYDRWSFASDPALNARACAALYARCGFGPWTKPTYGCRRP